MPRDAAMNHVRADPPSTAAGGVLARTPFRARFENGRLGIEIAMSLLDPLGLSDVATSSGKIPLQEALNNVVEHASPDGAPGDAKLVVRHGRAELSVEIRNSAKPMPNGHALLGQHPTDLQPNNDLPKGGFGWFHIREPAKDFVYDRKNGDRFLIFRMAIGAPPPSFYHLSKHSIGSAF